MGTVGGRLGCATAILIAAVVSFPLLIALAWSGAHCEPVPQCRTAIELHFGAWLAGVATLAGISGFVVRWAVNKLAARRSDEGASAGFVMAATVTALIVVGLVIAVSFAILDHTA